MLARRILEDPAQAWSAYTPTPDQPWDRARVAHLHRRAGFQASWDRLERDLADGPDAAIGRLLEGEPTALDGQPATQFERAMDVLAAESAASGSLPRLQAAWIYRMILTPHPLRERMARFWHGHFATSNAKVNNLKLMNRQLALFRSQGLAGFKELLAEVGRDPAMLSFLDSTTNRKAHPNENYAREVMELFSLGRGNYSETDVKEAARAFTGRFVQGDRFRKVEAQYDTEIKRILGKEGVLDGDSVVDILVAQPACARFLALKLYRLFVNEFDTPEPAFLEPVAVRLRESGYQIQAAVEMVLRSRTFHATANQASKVRSPVELAVGTVRALEILNPCPSPESIAAACTRMGEALYAPPNVAGWPGGTEWINTASSLERANLLLGLLSKTDEKIGKRFDPVAVAARERPFRPADPFDFYNQLLIAGPLQSVLSQSIAHQRPAAPAEPDRVRLDLSLILTAPEYQLG